MKINNPLLLRLTERLQGNRNFVPNYRWRNSAPLKVVERGYTDLFPTRRHIKINSLPILRPPKRLEGYQNLEPKYRGRNSAPHKVMLTCFRLGDT